MSEAISRYLDAAVLQPQTARGEAIQAIEACIELETYSVCVRPCDIPLAQSMCEGTQTKVCAVLGFPHGGILTESKVDEAKRYVDLGVDEVDMVANYGWIRSGLHADVQADIEAVATMTGLAGIPLKVIFETSQLNEEQIKCMVEICIDARADFVKTSTGFNGEGAQDGHVRLMLETAAGRIKVKPSGGIRDRARAESLVRMGAHRLGVNWAACKAICEGTGEARTLGSY